MPEDRADTSGEPKGEKANVVRKGKRCELPPGCDETDILDAYSRAVEKVVAEIAPAVVSIGIRRRSLRQLGAVETGVGSGVVVAPDGYILTNSHVIAAAEVILVRFMDGMTSSARLVGIDPATDLATIRVARDNLPHANFGDSASLGIGTLVIAIGNPLGFDSTVSTGVVSSHGRALRGQDGRLIENIIQHTAPLNPGSSGGPLVNTRGQVVGINTAIIAMAQGIGFAIPSNTASWVFSQILAHGRVPRGYLGISGGARALPKGFKEHFNLDQDAAVEIVAVEPYGPAARGGIREGDVLVQIGEQPVRTIDDLHRFLTEWPVGQKTGVVVIRGPERLRLEVVPTEAGAG